MKKYLRLLLAYYIQNKMRIVNEIISFLILYIKGSELDLNLLKKNKFIEFMHFFNNGVYVKVTLKLNRKRIKYADKLLNKIILTMSIFNNYIDENQREVILTFIRNYELNKIEFNKYFQYLEDKVNLK